MIRDKASSGLRSSGSAKFLTKNSTEGQSFFSCCSVFPANEQELRFTRKDSSNNKKISMKNMMKKSSILPSRSVADLSVDYSQSKM